jgi:hypothetical protein
MAVRAAPFWTQDRTEAMADNEKLVCVTRGTANGPESIYIRGVPDGFMAKYMADPEELFRVMDGHHIDAVFADPTSDYVEEDEIDITFPFIVEPEKLRHGVVLDYSELKAEGYFPGDD